MTLDLNRRGFLAASLATGAVAAGDDLIHTVAGGVGQFSLVDGFQLRDHRDESLCDGVVQFARQAQALGISGVPFFVLGEKYAISGAQPVELFEQALAQTWNELHGDTAASTSDDAVTAQADHDHGPSCEGDHCSV